MEYVKFSKFIISTQYGYTAEETSLVEGDAKYLRITDIVPYFVNKEQVPFCKIDDNKKKKYLITENDLLIARTGATTGYNLIVDESYKNFVFASYLIRFNYNKNDLYPLYLKYVLKSQQWYGFVNNFISGSAQPGMNAKVFGKFQIPFFNYDIQKRISNILSTYDKLIDNNNKRIKLLEQMAENLYKEWFVRFRIPRYKDVEFIDGFPKDWEKVKLDDVLNKIATGLNPRKNFVLGEGENFYVTIKNMADNTVYLDDKCDKVNDDAIIKINKRSDLKIGDLLFSGIGTIGRVCLIDIPTNNWNISESVFTMRANKKISSEFLYMLLLSQDVQNYCQSKANGSAQKGIRMGDLRKYTFLLPTQNVINDFTNQISPILRNVSLLRNENKNLIQQRDMLLPRLMRGTLKV
ncbi:MAG: restriction endonuclease subunit S [Veillonella sp.]|nr:restriction endonuclease subunit S [Veillonella sp.]